MRPIAIAAVCFVGACSPSAAPSDVGPEANGTDASDALDAVNAQDAPDAAPADAADVTTTPAEQAAFATLVSDTRNMLTMSHTPGASIAVVLHGHLAFARGIGVRNVASSLPVTTATRFRAASMSKMIVAATAMSLVRDGMLDLHAPITQYLPWFQLAAGFDASTLTLDLLLSHASGFPCDTISQCGPTTSGARQDFFVAYPQPLWAPPNSIWDYSNTGYALAAVVVTAAAGMPDGAFEQLAHDRVFVPAEMDTATYDTALAESGDYATGYALDASGNVVATEEPSALDCPLLHPPGGVLATATDYAHFAEALLANGGAVLDAAGVQAMEASRIDTHSLPTRTYGYGLMRQFSPYADHASVWHDGSLPGFLSVLWMVPDSQFAVVVMVNARGATSVPADVAGDAMHLFLTEHETVPPLTTPSSTWGAYAGTYSDAYGTLGTNVAVTFDGTTLSASAPNATDYSGRAAPLQGAMRQLASDEWSLPDGTAATFFPDASGTYRYLVTRRGVAVRAP